MGNQTDNLITRLYLIEEKPMDILAQLESEDGYTPWGPFASGTFGWGKDVVVDGSAIHLGICYDHRSYGYKQRLGIEGRAGQTLCHYQAELVPDREGITAEVRQKALADFKSTLWKYFMVVEDFSRLIPKAKSR